MVARTLTAENKRTQELQRRSLRYFRAVLISAVRITLAIFFTLISFTLSAQNKKVVFIIVDGIPPDVLEAANTPVLDAIAKAGTYTRSYTGGEIGGYSQSPTISAVGYNSLLTGVWANKHNVWDNDIDSPNYSYHNLFRILKAQRPSARTGVFSSWADNRTKLVGEAIPAAGEIKVDYKYDSLEYDTIRFPHDAAKQYMQRIDSAVTSHAAQSIRDHGPDLSWIYLEYTDDVGHQLGDSKAFTNAVEAMDVKLANVWDAVRFRQQKFKEDWLLLVTTDHGRSETNGKDHGGQSARQRATWIVSNKNLNSYAKTYYPAIVDLYPSIVRFMQLDIPVSTARELDGVALIGNNSIARPQANYFGGKLDIEWKAFEPNGTVKIWVATTNNFKSGSSDVYTLLGTVALTDQHATIDVSKFPASFYKIVLEGRLNSVNRWVVPSAPK